MSEKLVAACAKVREASGRSSRPTVGESLRRHQNYKKSNYGKANAVRRAATHCKHGHPFDGENLRVTSQGARKCRTCERIFNRSRPKKSDIEKDKVSRGSAVAVTVPITVLARRYEKPAINQELTHSEWLRLYGTKPKRLIRGVDNDLD